MKLNGSGECIVTNKDEQRVAATDGSHDRENREPPPLPRKSVPSLDQNIDCNKGTDVDCLSESNCDMRVCKTSSSSESNCNLHANSVINVSGDDNSELDRTANDYDTSSAVVTEHYDNVHVHATSQVKNSLLNEEKKDNTDDQSTNSDCEDASHALLEKHHDDIQSLCDISVEEIAPLNEHANVQSNDGHVAVVSHEPSAAKKSSWSSLIANNNHDSQARKAVKALGSKQSPKRSSPFAYKRWILTLSHRRRFEILLALGLFLWFAFFIVLAIVMNGPFSFTKDGDNGSFIDSSSVANMFPTAVEADIHHYQYLTAAVVDHSNSNGSYVGTENLATKATFLTVHSSMTESSEVFFTTSRTSSSRIDRPKSSDIDNFSLPPASVEETSSANNDGSAVKSTRALFTYSPSHQKDFAPSIPLTSKSNFFQEKAASDAEVQSTTLPIDESGSMTSTQSNRIINRIVYDLPQPINVDTILQGQQPQYLIGIGRADITGPAADVNMMGYANPSQISGGLHMRQYARTFIIEQQNTRIVFVNTDACMGSLLVKLEVVKRLQIMYGDLYTEENVCISGTHTHSAPAGFLQDVLFQVTSKGYVPETLKAMVDGIVESIRTAHDRVAPGSILINKGELLESNINRSPSAYINNPESERKKYKYNVDKDMILLKFLDSNGKGIGMLNWFPVHCTSMNNSNSLISGDNKGYAELLFERAMDPDSLFGESKFIAAFAQSNEGDVSPNTKGPHCIDTGLPCDNIHSTCNGKSKNCVAFGPGKDMFESTKIIGNNQFQKAMELYKDAGIALSGPLQAVHQYINMSNQRVSINSTHTGQTCKPAMGFSFAAGTTDGPGAFDFKQGDRSGNLFWKAVRNFLHSPSEEQKQCHSPKPILLDTGEMRFPYPWQPTVVDTQIFRIGNLIINSVPGEFTTMSGRRLRDAVLEVFSKSFPTEKFESVIAGLSNTYADYITTFEEYQVQRYEGASTIHGPHTLSAYIQQYKRLAASIIEKKTLTGGATAHDMKDKLLSFVPGVVADSTPFGYSFGDILKEADDSYNVGDVVSVQFVSGNPRSSPAVNMTFLTVEQNVGDGTWQVIHTDASWDTRYIWERSSTLGSLRGLSEVTVRWEISPLTPSGRYRIKHFGHYMYFWNRKIYSYSGVSKMFYVIGTD